MKVKSKAKNSATKKRSSYGGPKPLCNQDPEMEDCFNRSVRGKCGALTVADYPCGQCPFYKPAPYARLIRLERVDIIEKYELRKLFNVDGNQK